MAKTIINETLDTDASYKSRSRVYEIWRQLKKNKGAMVSLVIITLLILSAIFADVLFDYNEVVINPNIANRLQKPSLQHICGTDELGRDVFARIIHGGRVSLLVGISATIVGALIGVVLGGIAGYFGGRIEDVIMRISDIFYAIPSTLLAVVIVAALGQGIGNLIVAIGVSSVPKFIRVSRAAVLSTRNKEYIEAERAIGCTDLSIILKTTIPNSLSTIFVQITLNIATSIISVSAMSFIGLGVAAPRPEWGSMLSAGRTFLRGSSYLTLFPGLAIMLTILSFNMLGDGLRDAMDPKTKK